MRGRFITIEGLEGAGKSTQIGLLGERLEARGLKVLITREPSGTPLGEKLRELLLHGDPDEITPACELLMMFAARAAHLQSVIRPALARGEWVLCDRFTDASYAYQGAGRGISEQYIGALEALVQEGLKPDLTFLLDVPLEVGLARAQARRGQGAVDRFEREGTAFFERVRQRFLDIAEREPQRVRSIDANRPPEVVAGELEAMALKLLEEQDLIR